MNGQGTSVSKTGMVLNKMERNKAWHRRARVDALMAEAEFVAGDNSLMSRPRVLHKDQDYLNYNSFNLEWAEEDSPEYQAYMWQKKDDLDRLTIQENPNHPNPLMKPLH